MRTSVRLRELLRFSHTTGGDVSVLARNFSFDAATLVLAAANTFIRRSTSIPQRTPVALTGGFESDSGLAAVFEQADDHVIRNRFRLPHR
jgi:hypothetical protein